MMSLSHFFQVFLVFGVAGSIKSMSSGYLLDAEFNSTSNELSCLEFELKHRETCQNYEKKQFSFMTNMSIQPLWLTHLIEILLVLEYQLTEFVVAAFSYKAHFRPQISSNDVSFIHVSFSNINSNFSKLRHQICNSIIKAKT